MVATCCTWLYWMRPEFVGCTFGKGRGLRLRGRSGLLLLVDVSLPEACIQYSSSIQALSINGLPIYVQ
jgi:hypothetical protein